MQGKYHKGFPVLVLALILTSLACATLQAAPTATSTPEPTATITATPTNRPRPSPTPRPTWTPDLAATQHAEQRTAEVLSYYERGFLTSTHGQLLELDDFSYSWAQLGWYNWLPLGGSASDFFIAAHFKWNSALKTSDISGCGFVFSLQPDRDHYAVFLDRARVFLVITDQELGYSKPISPTRGTGLVDFDYPAEADFTLIVKGPYAYVLVNDEVVGEYTLSKSRELHGELGLTVLSGTNKDYGTLCEMTDLRLWLPGE
jgi:hypothetical protein